jgi:hypothetical protein
MCSLQPTQPPLPDHHTPGTHDQLCCASRLRIFFQREFSFRRDRPYPLLESAAPARYHVTGVVQPEYPDEELDKRFGERLVVKNN